MDSDEKITLYLSWAIIIAIIFLSYLIVKDFLVAIAAAFILAYLLKPIYDRLEKPLGKVPAALGTIIFVAIIFLLIIGSLIGSLISEITTILSGDTIESLFERIQALPFEEILTENLSEIIKEVGKFAIELIKVSASTIPEKFLALFITLFTTYYLLIDWNNIKRKVTEFLPFKNRTKVVNQIELVIKDILIGTFLLALLEATIATIVFWALGVKFAFVLGALIGIFAFVPALGPLLIWIPVALIELANGNFGTALGVTIMGLILSSYIDSIVRIRLVGKKSNIHAVVILVGLFGGIAIFGLIGFILGPLILSILLTIVENTPRIKFE